MKILNILGGPGIGKSTTAAGLFYEMKKLQLNVELVTEYAKDMVWEKRQSILDDQIYIFAKQNRRIERLKDHGIDWVITDSPIVLGLIYLNNTLPYAETFTKLVIEVFNRNQNYNFLLQRNYIYNPVGRVQKDEEEAIVFDNKVINLLDKWEVPFQKMTAGESAVEWIINNVI